MGRGLTLMLREEEATGGFRQTGDRVLGKASGYVWGTSLGELGAVAQMQDLEGRRTRAEAVREERRVALR